MRTETLRFTARLSAFTVSAGALAILLLAPQAQSVDRDALRDARPESYLEGLMIRHDVRYAMQAPVVSDEAGGDTCASSDKERG